MCWCVYSLKTNERKGWQTRACISESHKRSMVLLSNFNLILILILVALVNCTDMFSMKKQGLNYIQQFSKILHIRLPVVI